MQAFILYLCDISVMLEHITFHFIINQLTCSFNQQSYLHQSVVVILS